MSTLRKQSAAHSLRVQRDQLLSTLPDRWKATRGSRPVQIAPFRLASHRGRVGRSQARVMDWRALPAELLFFEIPIRSKDSSAISGVGRKEYDEEIAFIGNP